MSAGNRFIFVAFHSTRVEWSSGHDRQDWTKLTRLLQYIIYGSRQHGILFEADIVLFLSAYIDAAMELTATARVILAE